MTLSRKTPLKRTAFSTRTGRDVTTSDAARPARPKDPALPLRRRTSHAADPVGLRTRNAVKERDGYCCVACTAWIGRTGGHIHHRKLRSQGGTHDPENLIYLHHHCHKTIHDNPRIAYALGFLLKAHRDPAKCPVLSHWPVAA